MSCMCCIDNHDQTGGKTRCRQLSSSCRCPSTGSSLDRTTSLATGWETIVAGRRTFEITGGWAGDHHDGVPIFVLARQKPNGEAARWPLVTYLNDVESAMTQAKQAAGEKDVLVHGARTAQLALAAGVLDEPQIHLIPVLVGQGRRLFDHIGTDHIELELTRIVDVPGVTHIRYRICR